LTAEIYGSDRMSDGRPGPEVSVIIVNWNGRELLEECLRSLSAQTFRDFEVILVDNGSSDGSAEWVEKNHPEAAVLRLKQNLGFSAGNNAGLKLARGRFIALLNNDTKAEPGWLEALHRGISADQQIAACDSMVLYYDRPDLIWSAGADYTVAGSVSARHHLQPAARMPEKEGSSSPADVFVAVACAAIYRKKVIEEIGLFDEDFFNGYEDVDWSFRAHLFGHRIVNQPQAIVRHKVSSTQVHNSPEFVYHGQRNVGAVFLKNMPGWLLFKYSWLHLAYSLGSLVYFARAGRLTSFLRAKRDLLGMLPGILRKRKKIQAGRVLETAQVEALLSQDWLHAKTRKFLGGDPSAG